MTRTIIERRGQHHLASPANRTLHRHQQWLLVLLLLLLSPIAMNDMRLLAPCPGSPNCVSSLADDQQQRVAPLRISDNPEQSLRRLQQLLDGLPRVEYERIGKSRIQARFSSRWLRFVDDVTFFVRDNGTVEVRSASRVGYWDFGANRRRVESLREQLSPPENHD